MTLALEGRLAVNPFGKSVEIDRRPENIEVIDVKLDDILEKTITYYQYVEKNISSIFYISKKKHEHIISQQMETLTPMQINLFMQHMILTHKINDCTFGHYLTLLIKKSYDSGHTDFILNTNDTIFHNLGDGLDADKYFDITDVKQRVISITDYLISKITGRKKPIRITVDGNIGANLGRDSKNCIFTINGNAGDYCGNNSKNSSYFINGNTGKMSGEETVDCTFYVTENFELSSKGRPVRTLYCLEGTYAWSCHPRYDKCILRTTNKDVYASYIGWLIEIDGYLDRGENYGLKIQLIDKQGKIIHQARTKEW